MIILHRQIIYEKCYAELVYAWSFFQKTVSETFGWSNSETAWAFSLAIFMLGVTASWGGQNLQKFGPRKLALIGACISGMELWAELV